MTDAGIALDDIRDAFDGAASDGGGGDEVADVLGRLEESLKAQEAELRRKRSAVQRMRRLGSRRGLLDDLVSERLERAPEGSLRQDDLDALLVTERIFGPLGAVIQAGRFLALALHPELRAESDRVSAAEEALDDTVAVDDPRVAQVARERHAFETTLLRVIEESGRNAEDEAIIAAWDESHPDGNVEASDSQAPEGVRARNAAEVIRSMPYDFSPARLRCMEMVVRLGTAEATSSEIGGRPGA